jgi:4-hydroxy-3-methylbut-2-enyl diphosphate reductase
LFRLCEEKLGPAAYFVQSEASIRSRESVDHYVFVGAGNGRIESRPLWPGDSAPKRVLITGGASCPDGIIQQAITRINSFFPATALRSADEVLESLTRDTGPA